MSCGVCGLTMSVSPTDDEWERPDKDAKIFRWRERPRRYLILELIKGINNYYRNKTKLGLRDKKRRGYDRRPDG